MKSLNYKAFAVSLLASLVLIVLLATTSCGSAYRAKRCRALNCCETVKDSTFIHIKDSTYLIPYSYTVDGDSAYVVAWMECNQENQVIIRESEVVNGKYLRLQKDIENGKYRVVAYLPSRVDTVKIPVTEHSINSTSDKVRVQKVNELTRWQSIRLSLFWPLVCIIILMVVYLLRRFFS